MLVIRTQCIICTFGYLSLSMPMPFLHQYLQISFQFHLFTSVMCKTCFQFIISSWSVSSTLSIINTINSMTSLSLSRQKTLVQSIHTWKIDTLHTFLLSQSLSHRFPYPCSIYDIYEAWSHNCPFPAHSFYTLLINNAIHHPKEAQHSCSCNCYSFLVYLNTNIWFIILTVPKLQ